MFEKFRFFRQFHTENSFDFPGTNWPFTATSEQIILFLFKSNHFRTYFLYTIRYNIISRPVHDPHDLLRPPQPLLPKMGGRDLLPTTPRIDDSEIGYPNKAQKVNIFGFSVFTFKVKSSKFIEFHFVTFVTVALFANWTCMP